MRNVRMFLSAAVSILFICIGLGQAQQAVAANNAIVPNLVRFSGSLIDSNGKPLSGIVGVTFALYKDEQGGAALWLETQNVIADKSGNYTVALGSSSSTGLPSDIFIAGEARWLGVRPSGQEEQPRLLLLSVPYALKAGDAATVGGLPPSAFVLAPQTNGAATTSTDSTSATPLTPAITPPATGTTPVTTAGGTVNKLTKFDAAADITSSQIFDNGTSVGIGNTSPGAKLDVSGGGIFRGVLQLGSTAVANSTTKGFNSQPFDSLASVYNGSAAVYQRFRWQAEPVNPGLSTASGKLNLLFGSGTGTPAETGLSINSGGIISFAKGQTFPTVTGNETVTGNVSASQLISTVATGTAPLKVTSTTEVANLNASLLGGYPASSFALLGHFNSPPSSTFFTAAIIGLSAPINAVNTSSTETAFGFTAQNWAPLGAGILGSSTPNLSVMGGTFYNNDINNFGIWADNANTGTGTANVNGAILATADDAYGMLLDVNAPDFPAMSVLNTASVGNPTPACVSAGTCNAAGFVGNVSISGSLSKSGGSFKIDDPLDPANKYLYHSFVESPDMKNIYDGTVTTDSAGNATITLPDWFQALNKDFRYQLTPIGQFAQAIVATEIQNNQFTIRTDKPNVKVSWQVTGTRQDAWANAHRIPVEVEKPEQERGYYIHPELFGQGQDKSVNASLRRTRNAPAHMLATPVANLALHQ